MEWNWKSSVQFYYIFTSNWITTQLQLQLKCAFSDYQNFVVQHLIDTARALGSWCVCYLPHETCQVELGSHFSMQLGVQCCWWCQSHQNTSDCSFPGGWRMGQQSCCYIPDAQRPVALMFRIPFWEKPITIDWNNFFQAQRSVHPPQKWNGRLLTILSLWPSTTLFFIEFSEVINLNGVFNLNLIVCV